MKTSRLLFGVLLLGVLPAFAQPEIQPINGLPYPLVPPEDAVKMVQADKTIALHLRDVTLKAAFEELSKQSGITLDTSWGGAENKVLDQKLSLDIETHSFNEAFRAIIEEADVKARVQRFRPGNVLNVIFDDLQRENDGPVSGKAPFQIRAQSLQISSSRNVTLGKTPEHNQNSSLTVNLAADIDPLVPIIGSARIRITKAEDEQGRAIEWEDRQQQFNMDFDYNRSGQTLVRFKAPPTGSQKLAHLDGVMIYVLPTKYENWNVDDLLTAKDTSHEFKPGTQTIRATINNVRPTGNRLQMEIEIKGPPLGGMMNNNRSPLISANQLMQAMHLKDANGQELVMNGYNSTGDIDKLTVQANFTVVPQVLNPAMRGFTADQPQITGPVSMNLNIPVDFVQTEVPFSFSNLSLP